MATVFLGVQERLDRKVAIKVLGRVSQDRENEEKRFEREAKILARIVHPNVCSVFDYGRVGEVVYIALEWLDGGSLGDRLDKGLTVGESLSIVLQLARGLQVAHEADVIHRDLKPPNVMMRGDVPVLTDFGIARDLGSTLSATGMVVGTPAYMSPEQLQGHPIDGRADIYSLGGMFFELLTGRQPYQGATFHELAMQHIVAPIPRLPATMKVLQPVVDHMLAKTPDERFANCAQLIAAIKSVVVGSDELKALLVTGSGQSLSEQLRGLGISTDARTAVDEDAVRVLRSPVSHSGAAEAPATRNEPALRVQPAPANRLSDSAAAAIVAPPAWWQRPATVAAGTALALLIVALSWWAVVSTRDLDPALRAALRVLDSQLTQSVEAETFFGGDKAAESQLAGMRQISASDEMTLAAEKRLLSAIERKVDAQIKAGEIDAAKDLVVASSALFDAPDVAAMKSALEQARVESEQRLLRQRIAGKIRVILEDFRADRVVELRSEVAQWREITPMAEQVELGNRIAGTLEPLFSGALNADDVKSAELWRGELADMLPQHPNVAKWTDELTIRSQKLKTEALRSSLAQIIDRRQIDLSDIRAFAQAQIDFEELSADKIPGAAGFVDRVVDLAEQASAQGDLDRVIAIDDALRSYVEPPTLTALAGQARKAVAARAESVAQQRLMANRGTLAIRAAPWGRVVRVLDSNQREVPLPTARETPLDLSVDPGDYRVVISDGAGTAEREVSATVRSKQAQAVSVAFQGLSADDYLRAAEGQ